LVKKNTSPDYVDLYSAQIVTQLLRKIGLIPAAIDRVTPRTIAKLPAYEDKIQLLRLRESDEQEFKAFIPLQSQRRETITHKNALPFDYPSPKQNTVLPTWGPEPTHHVTDELISGDDAKHDSRPPSRGPSAYRDSGAEDDIPMASVTKMPLDNVHSVASKTPRDNVSSINLGATGTTTPSKTPRDNISSTNLVATVTTIPSKSPRDNVSSTNLGATTTTTTTTSKTPRDNVSSINLGATGTTTPSKIPRDNVSSTNLVATATTTPSKSPRDNATLVHDSIQSLDLKAVNLELVNTGPVKPTSRPPSRPPSRPTTPRGDDETVQLAAEIANEAVQQLKSSHKKELKIDTKNV